MAFILHVNVKTQIDVVCQHNTNQSMASIVLHFPNGQFFTCVVRAQRSITMLSLLFNSFSMFITISLKSFYCQCIEKDRH